MTKVLSWASDVFTDLTVHPSERAMSPACACRESLRMLGQSTSTDIVTAESIKSPRSSPFALRARAGPSK
ncbi:hypothetical protein D3C87_1888990 [compost metagenome]